MRVCSISVDLDEIYNYCAIHGVELSDLNEHAVYDVALPRLRRWAEALGVPLTLFTVGRDLERWESAAALRVLAEDGHEIANHSLDHYYDLTRRSSEEMREQVVVANERIEAVAGQRPSGFRAPGYVTTAELYEVLQSVGMSYSSSVFPCPWYYGAKGAAIGVKAVFGKRSASLVDDPRVLTAPLMPYRVGNPYFRPGGGVLELPIAVTPGLRLPFIGTSLMMAGLRGVGWLTRGMLKADFVNLELHGIDVLAAADGLRGLAPHQPDVRIPVARKLQILSQVVQTLQGAGYSFRTLADVAQHYAGQGELGLAS